MKKTEAPECKTRVTLEPGKEAPARPAWLFFPAILTFRAGTLRAWAGPHRPPWAYMSTDKPLPASNALRLKQNKIKLHGIYHF